MISLPELTEKEKKQPYAYLLEKEMAQPSEKALNYLSRRAPIDPGLAMIPENGNMQDILKDGYLEAEYGVCTLPGGKGYVAMLNQMPGVTFEMYKFWLSWWSAGEDSNLRYRIWNPKDHYKAGYRWSCEKIGSHLTDLVFIDSCTPENLGIDPKLAEKSSLLLADGGNVVSKCLDADPLSAPQPGVVCHFVREMEDGSGIELRSRFWKGYQYGKDGLFDCMGPDIPWETEETLFALAEHNSYEMANLAEILPVLYKMFGRGKN